MVAKKTGNMFKSLQLTYHLFKSLNLKLETIVPYIKERDIIIDFWKQVPIDYISHFFIPALK